MGYRKKSWCVALLALLIAAGVFFLYKTDRIETALGTGFTYGQLCGIWVDAYYDELGRAKFNDLFHEIDNPRRLEDLKALKTRLDSLDEQSECRKRKSLWDAYDTKWLKASREKAEADKQAQIREWEARIVDRGADIQDAVLDNGTFLAVPRKYIWVGSLDKDGFTDGFNLLFHYPSTSTACNNLKEIEIQGVLDARSTQMPCIGFDDKKICISGPFNMHFRTYLNCSHNNYKDGSHYRDIWRKACTYQNEAGQEEKPTFDKDLQLSRIGEGGYYTGDIEFPDYWMMCTKTSTGLCNSGFRTKSGLSFYYTFPGCMFHEHKKLQQDLISKIESFTTQARTNARGE